MAALRIMTVSVFPCREIVDTRIEAEDYTALCYLLSWLEQIHVYCKEAHTSPPLT